MKTIRELLGDEYGRIHAKRVADLWPEIVAVVEAATLYRKHTVGVEGQASVHTRGHCSNADCPEGKAFDAALAALRAKAGG